MTTPWPQVRITLEIGQAATCQFCDGTGEVHDEYWSSEVAPGTAPRDGEDLIPCGWCGEDGWRIPEVKLAECRCGQPVRATATTASQETILLPLCLRCGGLIGPCAAPDCPETVVYTGLCLPHAEEEYGPQHPSVGDLVGPL